VFRSEADRLEELEAAEAGGDFTEDDLQGVDIKNNAVAVINAQGIIQMVNKVCVWGCMLTAVGDMVTEQLDQQSTKRGFGHILIACM
jgi:hypothetical protein